MAGKDEGIPGGRVQRTAKVGHVLGSAGARYAGTRARNVVRSKDTGAAELDKRHMEAAERMVDALGQLKGAAMKIGQLASFIDTDFLPPEYRELYQDKLSKLRSEASLSWYSSRYSSGRNSVSMKEASWPIFIAAPFIVPSVSTIRSAASRWRRSSASAPRSAERATFAARVPA